MPAVLLVLAIFFLAAIPVDASGGARLTYRKIFKTSSPEFIEITLSEDGSATYDIRQLDDDAQPKGFEVGPTVLQRAFGLAAQLDNFRGVQLDVRKRLANLGKKTFRWERDTEAYEVTFNYTTNPAASELLNLFEGLSRQQHHLQTLTFRLRFDRLGVNEALLHFELELNRKVIPEPERLLPILQAIADESRVIEIARQRARALISRIESSR